MRLPGTVRITSKIRYEVLTSTCIDDNHGICNMTDRQIIIHPNQSTLEARKTFLHECLHAVSHEYGANLTETQVRALEEGLFQFFKLNKNLKF